MDRVASLLLGAGAGIACLLAVPADAKKKPPAPSGFEATLPILPAPAGDAPATGGIYSASAGYAPLYQGNRATRIGDPLTIVLLETTTASKSVSSSNGKSGSGSITPPSAGLLSFLNPNALFPLSTVALIFFSTCLL